MSVATAFPLDDWVGGGGGGGGGAPPGETSEVDAYCTKGIP